MLLRILPDTKYQQITFSSLIDRPADMAVRTATYKVTQSSKNSHMSHKIEKFETNQ